MSRENSILERIHVGLEKAGIPKRGRNVAVAEKTGYSLSMVAKLLSGHAAVTNRFVESVCNAFNISTDWVNEGKEPVLFDVETELDKIFEPITEAREKNIARLKSLIEGLNNYTEFKLVEDFIFDLFKKRK